MVLTGLEDTSWGIKMVTKVFSMNFSIWSCGTKSLFGVTCLRFSWLRLGGEKNMNHEQIRPGYWDIHIEENLGICFKKRG